MTIVIVGAQGQLGRALVQTAPTGCNFVAVDRQALDLAQREQILPALIALAPTMIINAAAYTAVDRAESEADLAWAINAKAVIEMAALARYTGAKLVHISTDFVFEGTAQEPILPEAVPNPLSVYGASKLGGERALSTDDLIVRTAWVHAATGGNFVNTMLRLMAEREVVRVVSDQHGGPTWASHLAKALWELCDVGATGIHHVTGQGATTWHEFAETIRAEAIVRGLLGVNAARVDAITSAEYPTAAKRPAYSVLDCASSEKLIGRRLSIWQDGLSAMLDEKARTLLEGLH